MVRIHVVRASRLLLGAGIAVLLAVVLWLAGRALLGGEETGESRGWTEMCMSGRKRRRRSSPLPLFLRFRRKSPCR